MSLEFPIDVYGLRRKVFNFTVAKTFLTLKELAQFKIYDEGYQRQRDEKHEADIKEFLTKTGQTKRYLPDIILAIRHEDINLDAATTYLSNDDFYIRKLKSYSMIRIAFWNQRSLEHIKIVDGNHRIAAIKHLFAEHPNSDLSNFELGVTFIITQNNQSDFENEMALFYYLNAKSKPLLPIDFLSKALDDKLDDETARDIDWWLYIFKKSYHSLHDLFSDKISSIEVKQVIANSCDFLANSIKKNDFGSLPNFLGIVREIIEEKSIADFIANKNLYVLLNILYFLYQQTGDKNKSIQEIKDFYRWLSQDAKLKQFEDFENLYQTYKETYIPKDFKIFIAMQFAGQDSVFKAISKTIKQVGKELDLPLVCERIDKHVTGTSYQITDEIFKKIKHNGLLIADITHKNPNVYLEVGYAMGLAKAKNIQNQVLLFVKDEGKDTEVGFDLQSYKQCRYKDTEHLRELLEEELNAYYSKLSIVR